MLRHARPGCCARRFRNGRPAPKSNSRLKYGRFRACAAELAPHLAAACAQLEFDCAVAVPLHRTRHRSRGFNQAEALLAPLGLPLLPGRLVRTVNTAQQVGQDRHERQANIAGAFAYEGPALDGLRVLVVDDVITTGATVTACARALRSHGAHTVSAVAVARMSFDYASERSIDD